MPLGNTTMDGRTYKAFLFEIDFWVKNKQGCNVSKSIWDFHSTDLSQGNFILNGKFYYCQYFPTSEFFNTRKIIQICWKSDFLFAHFNDKIEYLGESASSLAQSCYKTPIDWRMKYNGEHPNHPFANLWCKVRLY